MASIALQADGWRTIPARIKSAATVDVPPHLRGRLLMLQSERLHKLLPLLCVLVAANSLAMAYAIMGDLPVWQQAAPPIIITATCLIVLLLSRIRPRPATPEAAERQHHKAAWLAAILGVVAGGWSVNAFTETEQYYCMTAPVFTGIAAIISASCLLSLPRAAVIAMVAALTPIIAKLMTYDFSSLRAMAVMLALLTVMQAGVVISKFRETIATLALEDKLERLAETDALTGLDNRRSFERAANGCLTSRAPLLIALGDLDGFKQVNDAHGHQAGDAVLLEVANRIRQLAPAAASVARLGGDEFAILYSGRDEDVVRGEIEALTRAIHLPFVYDNAILSVGCSFGIAVGGDDGDTLNGLLHSADMRLYENKKSRSNAEIDRRAFRGAQ